MVGKHIQDKKSDGHTHCVCLLDVQGYALSSNRHSMLLNQWQGKMCGTTEGPRVSTDTWSGRQHVAGKS